MIITPVPHELDLTFNKAERTKGLHMSDIYNDLHKKLDPKRYGGHFTKDEQDAYMGAGMALEDMLEEGLIRRLSECGGGRPGEFTSNEGIIYSPDLILFNGATRLGEIKLTWMSSKEVPREKATQFPPKFAKYFTQMKSYCYCLETGHARLYAFFVNGDYRKRTPELLAWDIEFSKRDLEENWTMMMNHARHMGVF